MLRPIAGLVDGKDDDVLYAQIEDNPQPSARAELEAQLLREAADRLDTLRQRIGEHLATPPTGRADGRPPVPPGRRPAPGADPGRGTRTGPTAAGRDRAGGHLHRQPGHGPSRPAQADRRGAAGRRAGPWHLRAGASPADRVGPGDAARPLGYQRRRRRAANGPGPAVIDHDPPPSVAARLGIGPAARRRRVRSVDGEPHLLVDDYFPAQLAHGTPLADSHDVADLAAVLAGLGHTRMRYRDEIRTRMPTRTEIQTLRLPPATAVLEHTRIGHPADGGHAVHLTVTIIPGDRHVITIDVPAAATPDPW